MAVSGGEAPASRMSILPTPQWLANFPSEEGGFTCRKMKMTLQQLVAEDALNGGTDIKFGFWLCSSKY